MTETGPAAQAPSNVASLPAAQRAALERALLLRRPAPARPPGLARRADAGSAPLSYAQQGMWFLEQWQRDGTLYCVAEAFRLAGPLDVAALRQALAAVIARHDTLRTTFTVTGAGTPVQVVAPAVVVPVPVVDLRGLPAASAEAAVRDHLHAQATRPFDLARAPMARVSLLRLGAREHVLLLALHHIVADGLSCGVLARELSAGYAARVTGSPADLPVLPVQYADFAAAQRQGSRKMADDLDWWRSRLTALPPPLALPADRPRPATASYRGDSVRGVIPANVAARLRTIARGQHATLFMTLLAAYHAFLHQYTGQGDILVGFPVAGRTAPGTEALIGCFINTLVSRTEVAQAGLSGGLSFLDLLGRVRDDTLDAYAHQEAPFERVIEELRVTRSASRGPLVQTMLAMQGSPGGDWDLPGVTVQSLDVAHQAELLDLSVSIVDGGTEVETDAGTSLDVGPGLEVTLSYSTDLFDRATATRFLAHFRWLLAEIAADPSRPVPPVPPVPAASAGGPVPYAYLLDDQLRPVPPGAVGELFLARASCPVPEAGEPPAGPRRLVPDPFGPPGSQLHRTGEQARLSGAGTLELTRPQPQRWPPSWLGPQPDEAGPIVTLLLPGEQEPRPARLARQHPDGAPPASPPPAAPGIARDGGEVIRATEVLQLVWREVLGPADVSPDTDFFRAGGHSLLAIQVLARVRALLGVDLPVKALFTGPTPAALAVEVEAARRDGAGPARPPIRPVPRPARVPLSRAQRRLWFIDRLDPAQSHHIMATVPQLDGPLRGRALGRAIGALTRRHESLRTTFHQSGADLWQEVSDSGAPGLPVVDLAGLGPDAAEQGARDLARQEARRPFDLSRGPVLRAWLARLTGTRHVLVLAMHHIVTDAWSWDLLLTELWALYAADGQADRAALPPLAAQYADYALWERQWADDAALEPSAAYWRRQLAGAPEAMDLARDFPPPAAAVFRSATVDYAVPPGLTREIADFSLRHGVTVYVTVLTAYLIILARHAGQADLVIGAGAANRGQLETEQMIGFFTNQLVLRCAIAGDETVAAALTRVRDVTLDAYAHADMPFDRLVEILQPTRALGRHPVFQAEIEYHRQADRPPAPPGITITPWDVTASTITVDLSLHVVQTETVLRGGLAYNAEAFAPATIRRMTAALTELLAGMVAAPDALVDEVASGAMARAGQATATQRAADARALFDRMRAPRAGTASLGGQP